MTQSSTLSVEFFPPRTPEARARFEHTRDRLAVLKPGFFSVTFGAGGSTQDATLETVVSIIEATGIEAAPHLSCVGMTLEKIRAVLRTYRGHGISRVVALRGDMPSGTTGVGELRYANELVEFIRRESGDAFHIEVAAYPEFHPQAASARSDLDNFKRKVDAGANSAITQYFYNADAYYRFLDSVRGLGIEIPIVPGIMPITNYSKLARFSDACGAEIPRWVRKQLEAYGDDVKSIQAFGEQVISEMCETLLQGGAPGLHFYTLNQADPSLAIWNNLKLPR